MSVPDPQAGSTPARVTPTRKLYLIPLAIVILLGAPSTVALVRGIGGLTEGLVRATVPGRSEVTFDEAGTWTVFYEYKSTFEGRTYNTQFESPGIGVSLETQDGTEISSAPSVGELSYSLPGQAGRSIASIEVPDPGTYTLIADYATGTGEEAVLALGHEKGKATIATVLGGIGLFASLALALIVAGVILILRIVRRRRLLQSRPGGVPPATQ